jgi:SAM-dependent methyltransferase
MASARPLRDTQQFFAERATTWDERFPDDGPAYAQAAAELDPPAGGTLLDLGCGTARALRPLRAQIGPAGTVIALDATWEMLRAAGEAGRQQFGDLVAADALSLPLRDRCLDAVFAAGILHHLPGPDHGLAELARTTRPGARMAVFHPIGRATLAARHGGTTSDDDFLAAANLERALRDHGWELASIDDGDERYLAIAVRG